MNARKPVRKDDQTPWRPGNVFSIQPIDVAAIRVRVPTSSEEKIALLRMWKGVAESVADHAIGKMLRSCVPPSL